MINEGNYREGITDLIVATLLSGRNTRLFKDILHQREFNRHKKESVRVTMSRLSSKGYIANSNAGWSITKKGKKYYEDRHLLGYISSPFDKDSSAKMIIAFDIPE